MEVEVVVEGRLVVGRTGTGRAGEAEGRGDDLVVVDRADDVGLRVATASAASRRPGGAALLWVALRPEARARGAPAARLAGAGSTAIPGLTRLRRWLVKAMVPPPSRSVT